MKSDFSKIYSLIGQGNLQITKMFLEGNTLSISMRTNHSDIEKSIKFLKVVDLELRTGSYSKFSVVGLQIEDISNYQMEGKRIRVASEDDQSYIFFYCNDFEITT